MPNAPDSPAPAARVPRNPRQSAGVGRRTLATAVDLAPVLALTTLPYLVGIMGVEALTPPQGIYWPDHLLTLLGAAPWVLVWPLAWPLALWCLWDFFWLYFGQGRTPGDRLMGVQVVDLYGKPPDPTAAALHALGHALSGACLGLGWAWALVTPRRRAWPELLAGLVTVRPLPPAPPGPERADATRHDSGFPERPGGQGRNN